MINKFGDHILNTLNYFDVFNHPLKLDEIYSFLPIDIAKKELIDILTFLVYSGDVYQYEDYFSLNNSALDVYNRKILNNSAEMQMPIAKEKGNLILSFPYIKAVFISGSLSKGVFDESVDDDIDFFIITQKNRLWLAKFLLKFYKLIYLNNSKKYFCINYFISENKLKLTDENRFVATELATLIPIGDSKYLDKLVSNNKWIYTFLPNIELQKPITKKQIQPKPRLSKIIQTLTFGIIGTILDYIIMYLHRVRNYFKYYRKFKHKNYHLRFRSTRTESKMHPPDNQTSTLEKFELKKKQSEKVEHE